MKIWPCQLLSPPLPLFGAAQVALFASVRGQKPSEFRYQFHFSNRSVTLQAVICEVLEEMIRGHQIDTIRK